MAISNASRMMGCVAALLLAGQPAGAVMRQGDVGSHGAPPPKGAANATSAVNRDGFVQALDPAAHTIVINGSRYEIGAPMLALQDKRPNANGLLNLASVKVGMYVRYRVQASGSTQRVVEMWVMRDPQPASGAKP